MSTSTQPQDLSPLDRKKEENYNAVPCIEPILERSPVPPSELRQNLFMIFITLTQLVQMIPLGVGINSGLALGEALGAPPVDSVWIVASYPMTQGAFVLIGQYSPSPISLIVHSPCAELSADLIPAHYRKEIEQRIARSGETLESRSPFL